VIRFTRIANGLESVEAGSTTTGDTPLASAFVLVTGGDQAAFEATWVAAVTEAARGS
jgi:hypothetical protein